MRYLLLIYGDEAAWASAPPEDMAAMTAEYVALGEALQAEGVLVGGDPLHPTSTATTVRVRDGEALLSDGPFAETHEQLAGYYLLECETLDQAVAAAARVPSARVGSVEVRPIRDFP